MIRPTRHLFSISLLALVVCASFAGGRRLRQVAGSPLRENTRIALGDSRIIGASEFAGGQGDGNPADTFDDVYRYIHSDYVDKVNDDRKLANGAVRMMLAVLDDPKTRFLDPTQLKTLQAEMSGKFAGIGATVTVIKTKKTNGIEQRRLAVVAPVPGGPADKAGIRAGDFITYIDSKWIIAFDPRADLDRLHTNEGDDQAYRNALKDATKKLVDGVTLQRALDLIQAKDGKTVQLTVERAGAAQPLKIPVVTASTEMTAGEFKDLGGGIGYLRVTQFSDAIGALTNDLFKISGLKGVVLDLRDNPGGPVEGKLSDIPTSAEALLSRLSREERVAMVLRKANQKDIVTVKGDFSRKVKVAVLINGGTANTAEVVASALKEKGGATLIGSRTFGDSSLQRLITLRAGGAITVTAGKFLTANGIDFSGKGIQPDISVESGTPKSDDPAVQRARQALAG